MADSKLTALTAETAPVGADLVYLVDDVAGTPTSKKATVTDLAASTPFSGTYAPLALNTAWELLFERDGSITGNTQSGGTWSAASGLITITQGTGAYAYIYFAGTELPSVCYLEMRVRATAGADRRVGIILPSPAGAVTNFKPCVMLQYDQSSGTLALQAHNGADIRTLTSQSYSNTTWYTIGMQLSGTCLDAYIDGVLKASSRYNTFDPTGAVPGMVAFGGTWEIDYLRAWGQTGPT